MDIATTKMYIDKFGTKTYKNSNGQLHRIDGPAREYKNGDKWWYKEGEYHRENGPAMEYANGDKVWYKEGKLHREDGPAWEWANVDKEWYLLFKELEEKEFNSWTSRIKKFV